MTLEDFCTPFQKNIDILEDLFKNYFFPNARLLLRLYTGIISSKEQFSGLIRPFLCNLAKLEISILGSTGGAN